MHVHVLPITVSIFYKIPIFPNHFICHIAVYDFSVNGTICFIQICIMVALPLVFHSKLYYVKCNRWTTSIHRGSSLRFEVPTLINIKSGIRFHEYIHIKKEVSLPHPVV
jgi:hypothetical protein